MSAQTKARLNWPLLMPAILLVFEVVAIITIRVMSYEITQLGHFFFIVIAIFLVFQFGKRLISFFRVRSAMRQLDAIDQLIESGQSLAAVKQCKRLLLNLPEDKYLEILSNMAKIYEREHMTEAANQARIVYAESVEFFNAISDDNQNKIFNMQDWKNQVITIRSMIQDLPEEKE